MNNLTLELVERAAQLVKKVILKIKNNDQNFIVV